MISKRPSRGRVAVKSGLVLALLKLGKLTKEQAQDVEALIAENPDTPTSDLVLREGAATAEDVALAEREWKKKPSSEYMREQFMHARAAGEKVDSAAGALAALAGSIAKR
jgi:hypothetical protein